MPVERDFARQYSAALNNYIGGDGEAALKAAYDLGRRAATQGIGILELTGVHEQALADRLRDDHAEIAKRGARFLLESLSPYEMTHRGFRETNAALLDLNETLEQRVRERTAEAEAARANAERANQAKSDFLAIMSHELRTPLNAVIGYADLLDSAIAGALTEDQQKYVRGVRASASHLLEVIEEILAFAKIEAGRDQVHWNVENLNEVIQEAAALIEPVATQRGIEFQVAAPSAETTITTDRQKLRQILINLLSNAVKFTDASGRVTLRASESPEEVVLEVEDTGVGISAEHQEHIFDSFWQVERATTRRVGGTGLGLSVTRTLTRRLGGEVSVTSEPGRGSTFTVRLPKSSRVH